jgi:hypothetical protein
MKGFWEWLDQYNEAAQYIDPGEYEERLTALGWRIEPSGSHRTAYAPDGIGKVTWTVNNWEKNWHQIARDLLRFAKGGRGAGGYPLEFVWQTPFRIPTNFDYKTQTITKTAPAPTSQKVMVSKLLADPSAIQGQEVQWGDEWKRVELADHGNDGVSIEVMFDDGTTIKLPMQQTITLRQAA